MVEMDRQFETSTCGDVPQKQQFKLSALYVSVGSPQVSAQSSLPNLLITSNFDDLDLWFPKLAVPPPGGRWDYPAGR
jgi:hypothetical protein